jgi:hypothetical protein
VVSHGVSLEIGKNGISGLRFILGPDTKGSVSYRLEFELGSKPPLIKFGDLGAKTPRR